MSNSTIMKILFYLLTSIFLGASVALGEKHSDVSKGILWSDHWGANMTTPEIIAAFGYPVEIHHLTTDDGYILEMHRIPHGIKGSYSNEEPRPVAYLEHCLLCSSADYIMDDPNGALAYILADNGYDVWLSNMRGNTYSRNHTTFDPNDIEFWKFSWDEMAYYDVPASIDYVLEKTGSDSVHYIGWSMGTTVFWAMMSERPDYNNKVKVMVAMAPVAYLNNSVGLFPQLAKFTPEFEILSDLLGVGEMFPSGKHMDYLMGTLCDQNNTLSVICYDFLYYLCGPDPEELDKEILPAIMSHTPAGASTHTITHFGQLYNSGEFCKYDYGLIGNMEHYGQSKPPSYNLSNVVVPVGLFHSSNDFLADPQDVSRLASQLPNLALDYKIPNEKWNHMDFGWGIHAKEYVYEKLLEFISDY